MGLSFGKASPLLIKTKHRLMNYNYPPPIIQAPERTPPIYWIFAAFIGVGAFFSFFYFVLNILSRRDMLDYSDLAPIYTIINVLSLLAHLVLYILAIINIRHSTIKLLVIIAAIVHIFCSAYWILERFIDRF